MNYIDFHTHVFPDKIAAKTVDMLAAKANMRPRSNGTLNGLQTQIKVHGTLAVALPVLTKPQSFESVLAFAEQINAGYFAGEHDVYSFAGMHPDVENVEEKMSLVKQKGFKGIKIHPDYQQTFIDDERYVRILRAAACEDLIVVTHSGVDVGYPEPVHCTPQGVLRALEQVGTDVKLVLAHYGACDMYEDVYTLLAGKNVYFDTAYVLPQMDKDTFLRILAKHGDDKVLFATDSPWRNVDESITALKNMGLTHTQMQNIVWHNAAKLLGKDVVCRK